MDFESLKSTAYPTYPGPNGFLQGLFSFHSLRDDMNSFN